MSKSDAKPWRVLVCGGRKYRERAHVFRTLDVIHRDRGIAVIIEGDGTGADRLARWWSHSRRVENLPFPAMWKAYGKGAGPIRNRQMLDEGRPDVVIAFPGGNGTADMIYQAERAGVPVIKVDDLTPTQPQELT